MKLFIRSLMSKQNQPVIAVAIVCSMLLALPACNIPNLRHPEPTPGLPIGFNTPTGPGNTPPLAALVGGICAAFPPTEPTTFENSGMLSVEDFYNDPILTFLIFQAENGNRELKILNEDVQIASNAVLARRGAYFPFLTVGGGGGFDRSSRFTRDGAVDEQLLINDNRILNPLPNSGLSLDLFWTPDIFGALHRAQYAAQQRYYAAIERRNNLVNRIVAEVSENYFRLKALDNRLATLDQTISLQQQSLEVSIAKKAAGQGTELAVQRFTAEVRRNQSEKLIVHQEIVQVENRINTLANRFPQPIERISAGFLDLNIRAISLGVPSQLLLNRPDIRQAERELTAAGLDVRVARASFYPSLTITAGIGYEAFNPRFLFSIDSLIANVAGNLVAPLINKAAIRAEYLTANAQQLQAIYEYQRIVVTAFTEVVNNVTRVENYRKSIEIKQQQLDALQESVSVANNLFQNAQAEYIDVLLAQRELQEAKLVLIETKQEQLSAIVSAYQALGGGNFLSNPNQQVVQVPPLLQGQP